MLTFWSWHSSHVTCGNLCRNFSGKVVSTILGADSSHSWKCSSKSSSLHRIIRLSPSHQHYMCVDSHQLHLNSTTGPRIFSGYLTRTRHQHYMWLTPINFNNWATDILTQTRHEFLTFTLSFRNVTHICCSEDAFSGSLSEATCLPGWQLCLFVA